MCCFAKVAIFGKNFGPTISTLSSVWYLNTHSANATRFVVDVSRCSMLTAHETISCFTIPGAGSSLEWALVVDGQTSTNPSTSYSPPGIRDAPVVPFTSETCLLHSASLSLPLIVCVSCV